MSSHMTSLKVRIIFALFLLPVAFACFLACRHCLAALHAYGWLGVLPLAVLAFYYALGALVLATLPIISGRISFAVKAGGPDSPRD